MDGRPLAILLIEDNPGDARLIREALADYDAETFDLQTAGNLRDGLDRLTGGGIALVLLDLSLPESRGIDTLARVLDRDPQTPVIVLTGTSDESLAVEAVRRGAQDYLVKGQVDGRLLGRAIRYAVERKEAHTRLAEANQRLAEANRRLEELATTDDLTGLWNRRYFLQMLDREFARTARRGAGLALAMIDLDHFKRINDTCGHGFGDKVLCQVAHTMRRESRAADLVARYGGEEFIVLMPAADTRAAAIAAERLRRAIAERPVRDDQRTMDVTVSVGVASLQDAIDGTTLLRHVDEALYAAKQAGRNCVRTWTEAERDPPGDAPAPNPAMADLEGRIATLSLQAKDAFVQSIRGLVQALEARDPYTRHHSENVTRYAVAVAEQMGLDGDEVAVVRRAAQVHDIGKIGIADALLRKPGRLTERERRAMRQHVVIGVHILEELRFLERELPLVRHHHERWDGKGYPDGLAGEAIPRGARVLAVADAFDALTSDRPYHAAVGRDEAVAVLAGEAGRQFDADAVDALTAWLSQGEPLAAAEAHA
jgi:diguanylate cyclase (GGDEF)-like protein/putative nucleotidyltransferase with HDIG domain